jgi:hypothetical protein
VWTSDGIAGWDGQRNYIGVGPTTIISGTTEQSAVARTDPIEALDDAEAAVRHLLIRGPAMSGKRALAERLSARSEGAPLWVTTTDAAGRVRSDVGRPDLRVVDAVTRQSGTAPEADDRTWYAASPADLTGLGMRVSEGLEAANAADPPVVFLDSVSTLLLYADLERVYQFLHVVTSRIDALDGRSVHLLHTDGTGETDVATLTQLYSHVLETRRQDGAVQFRVTGRGLPEPEWRDVE